MTISFIHSSYRKLVYDELYYTSVQMLILSYETAVTDESLVSIYRETNGLSYTELFCIGKNKTNFHFRLSAYTVSGFSDTLQWSRLSKQQQTQCRVELVSVLV